MLKIYPLKFKPILKPVIWGGSKIGRLKRLTGDIPDNIGESWELSGVPGHESVVDNGIYAGRDIKSLLGEYGAEILGASTFRRYGTMFPILVKFIDAAKDLSIQVHPGDEIAQKRHNCCGKTELWYIMHADSGAVLYSGFCRKTDKASFRKQIETGNVEAQLNRFYTEKGDVFYLPAGRVHGIGAGNFLVEIQQPSDITYRIYDFDRIDKDGKKRELHTDLALDAIDFEEYHDYKTHLILEEADGEKLIKRCDKFVSTLFRLNRKRTLPVKSTGGFRIMICIGGSAKLTDDMGNSETLSICETVLLPYEMQSVTVEPVGGLPMDLISVELE